MLRILAHDTVNDIALIQTSFCYSVRYGLQVEDFDDLAGALDGFHHCQSHALHCAGHFDD